MTEKLNIEQAEFVNTQAAEAEKEKGATGEKASYGKFKNAESLLSAYNSLQAEFTRRCQRLKELEEGFAAATESARGKGLAEKSTAANAAAEGEAVKAAGETAVAAGIEAPARKTVPDVIENSDVTENAEKGSDQSGTELKTDSEPTTGDDENKEKEEKNAPARVISAKEREDVLREYLESVLQKKTGAILMEGAGASLKTPRSRPKTVEEAGRLFRESVGANTRLLN